MAEPLLKRRRPDRIKTLDERLPDWRNPPATPPKPELSWMTRWSIFRPTITFEMEGVTYEYAEHQPDFTGKTVRRFTYGEEPQVIAHVPLANGETIESHGYVTHWTKDDVDVAWTDDRGRQCTWWVSADHVRRPAAADEWQGNYLPR